MRVIVINTGTEILLGDVLNTHLAFIAREVFYFGLRIDEQRTIPDGDAIQSTLADVSSRAEIVFVTGGLGPTSDDITRELVAGYLQLPLIEDATVHEAIRSRLAARRIPTTERIWRRRRFRQERKCCLTRMGPRPACICRRVSIRPFHRRTCF